MRAKVYVALGFLALLGIAALFMLSSAPASAHESHRAAGVDEQYEQDEMNERMQPGRDFDHDSEKGERIPPMVLDGSQDLDPHQLSRSIRPALKSPP